MLLLGKRIFSLFLLYSNTISTDSYNILIMEKHFYKSPTAGNRLKIKVLNINKTLAHANSSDFYRFGSFFPTKIVGYSRTKSELITNSIVTSGKHGQLLCYWRKRIPGVLREPLGNTRSRHNVDDNQSVISISSLLLNVNDYII